MPPVAALNFIHASVSSVTPSPLAPKSLTLTMSAALSASVRASVLPVAMKASDVAIVFACCAQYFAQEIARCTTSFKKAVDVRLEKRLRSVGVTFPPSSTVSSSLPFTTFSNFSSFTDRRSSDSFNGNLLFIGTFSREVDALVIKIDFREKREMEQCKFRHFYMQDILQHTVVKP